MIDFLLFFLLFVVFGALVINGWYLASRGEIETEPDGTKVKEGALFKSWQIFWEQKRETKKFIQYKGKQLYDLKREVIQTAKQEGYDGTFLFFDEYILATKSIEKYINSIQYQIRDLKIETTKSGENKDSISTHMTLYKKQDVYVFPEWIRMMMASCITCHASFYGSVIFWAYILLFGRFMDTDAQLLGAWVAYILSLSFVNTFFYKQLNKH